MEKEIIKSVLDSMCSSFKKEQIELFRKLINEECYDRINDFEDFNFALIWPFENFLSGLIRSEICDNDDVVYIYLHSYNLEKHFDFWFEKIEGPACCADKTRTIIRKLISFYEDGVEIEFDYNQEYTFQLPEIIFKTHDEIISFYEALKSLSYGNPEKYLQELLKFKSHGNKEI
jgi:hypothetical protein